MPVLRYALVLDVARDFSILIEKYVLHMILEYRIALNTLKGN